MTTTRALQENEHQYLEEMRAYIAKLKRQLLDSPEEASKEAKDALIRTGVTTSDGKEKINIVSWE